MEESKTGQNTSVQSGASRGGKYLTFKLAEEEYGLEILKVREINRGMGITTVPQMPDYVKGIINLRGRVNEEVKILLDIDRVLNDEELIQITSTANKETKVADSE